MSKKSLFALCVVMLVGASTLLADTRKFRAELTGDAEVPNAVATDTTGKAEFKADRNLTEIDFKLELENGVGILGGPGGHIHCAPFGQNGPIIAFLAAGLTVGFDGDVKIEATLNQTNINDVGCGATVAEVVESMRAGLVYVNIHSNRNPPGEVRGQVYAVSGMVDDEGEHNSAGAELSSTVRD